MNATIRSRQFRAAGADVVVPADTPPEAIVERVGPLLRYGSMYQSVSEANRELREQSLQDCLTGLPNRRHFSQDLARNVEMARRIGRPLSCVIVDIDDFKRINDTYGHPAGDGVIRRFGSVMNRVKRMCDSVARLGGDEFAWLLVDADPANALQAANRARRLVGESVFEEAPGPVRLTATFGVSSLVPGVEQSADELVGNADRSLYWGKECGKNVVKFYPPRKVEASGSADRLIS
jgi:diguanylate cyclase (GGDEF)-like protein